MKKPTAILEPVHTVKIDDFVVALAWSPDGRSLGVAGGESRICLLQGLADKPTAKVVGEHMMGAVAVAWQPGGRLFASAGQDGRLLMFDANSGEVVMTKRPSRQPAGALIWAPDGKHLAYAAGKSIFLCSPETDEPILLHESEAAIVALAYDKSGRELAAARNGGMDLHRFVPQHQHRRYSWASPCLTAAFSPNGRYLATGTQDGAVHFWYLATGKDSQMRGYPERVLTTSWRNDSRYLATTAANQIVVWDFSGKGPEGSRPLQLSGHTERLQSCAFQPDGPYLASIGRDWRLSLWQPGKFESDLDAHMTAAEPTVLAWSPDGLQIAVGMQSGHIGIYRLQLLG